MEKKDDTLGFPKIPEAEDVIVGELAERGEWIVANITTNSFWPVTAQKAPYRGESIWILPIMKNYFPAVAMRVPPGKNREECERLLMHFLSNLAWVQEKGFLVDGFSGGSLPAPMWRDKIDGFSICEEFDLSYFPEPTDDKALLALALMREGRGLNHPGYAFLSFYRVLEVALPDGKKRGQWISDRVDAITNHRAKEALAKLLAQGIADVGVHLRDSGRRAIAHAREKPIIDPDDPSDSRRLWSELPIMTALAQLAIEELLHVETSYTVWKKHLYELSGFKEILGPDIVDHLIRGEQITDERVVDVPKINVQLRRHEPYPPLSNLVVKEILQKRTECYMRFESEDGGVRIRFKLDFADERLHFDIFSDLAVVDTGTPQAAKAIAESRRFSKEYFGNGQLHIYNAETGALIARKDPYVPVNMHLDHEAANAEIASWDRLAVERHERNRRYGEEMVRLSTPYAVHVSVAFACP
ncbi:methylamine utilization protein MauJ [Methylocystis iwaonis]|uniref:Uncharacterized protein n=1 Tax=Methylocystis iwaonis TaxID=2885079 RepID=A0ABM8E7J9_9HYPH|nr:methylamine utilization protein MauJ [Methylocystis iwaonis]BDV33922.1 hypothetical protein SS37A_14510 [Methylocystis iwaonis]